MDNDCDIRYVMSIGGDTVNSVDFDPTVASSDAYGNVTVKREVYKGYSIDPNGTIWAPSDNYMGKSASIKQAKALIDEWVR